MTPLLWVAGLIELSTAIPYIIDIRRGRTKPAIVSWMTWMILSLIAGFASFSSGSFASTIISFALVGECILIIVFSLKKGHFTYTRFDAWCQFGALLGLGIWWWTKDPLSGLLCFVIVDLVGALPTLRHAWRRPKEETFYTFSASIFGNGLALAAIPIYTFSEVVIPAYLLLLNATITGELYFRKMKKRRIR